MTQFMRLTCAADKVVATGEFAWIPWRKTFVSSTLQCGETVLSELLLRHKRV